LAEKTWIITIKAKTTKSVGRGFSYATQGEKMEDKLLEIRLRSREDIERERLAREKCEAEGHIADKDGYACSRCLVILDETKKPAKEEKTVKRGFDTKPSEKRSDLFEKVKNIEAKEDDLTIIGVLNRLAVNKEQRKAKWQAMHALEDNFGVTEDVINRIEAQGMLAISYITSGEIEEK
jgi:hypothetical protein